MVTFMVVLIIISFFFIDAIISVDRKSIKEFLKLNRQIKKENQMSKIVLVENDGTNRDATHEDLKQYHPKCYECSLQKGVHGKIGQEIVFCKAWNQTVDKNGYCNRFTQ